ncbi:MAG: hypothetical protein CV087_23855 [Candidatus Brocadia sp. WS118]|nr:MAG: hypothetical protein CV087_23855 [Candidatus Brocadia sp. WS118]
MKESYLIFHDPLVSLPKKYVEVYIYPSGAAYVVDDGRWRERVGIYTDEPFMRPIKFWAYPPDFNDHEKDYLE